MVTKNHLIYDILNSVRGGKISDDELISKRQVGFWVDSTRALLIKRELDKGGSIDPSYIQSLGCVPVDYIDASDCPCVLAGCEVLRTVNPLPITIQSRKKPILTRVGPVDITKPAFSVIEYARAPYATSNRWTKDRVYAFIHNRHVYIIGDNLSRFLSYINVQGIFAFPEDAAGYEMCDTGNTCYTDDSEYPISAELIQPLKDIIMEKNLRVAANSPTDTQGDGKHEINRNEG